MNDNFKKLCMQYLDQNPNEIKVNPENFARLLINECITVMEQHDFHGEWLGEKIKEHFGISGEN